MNAASRRIWLCADDYGISPGVNRAIRDLIARGRLNATSVMVIGPAIGLHATLTAPFRPLTMHFRPLEGGMFPSFSKLLLKAMLRRLDSEIIQAELKTQLTTFRELFGRSPDFVDGHQHVQLYPQVRDALLSAVKLAAPDAWVRQCGRQPSGNESIGARFGSPKAAFLDLLSAQFRRRASAAGISFNPAFAGAYEFSRERDFSALMHRFLKGLPEGGLIMCHPGFVDDILVSLDPLTEPRETEHAFLGGEHFPELLAAHNFTLG